MQGCDKCEKIMFGVIYELCNDCEVEESVKNEEEYK